ncbi:hypothetical protein MPTK1_5g08650 [Marchantia polymorpha subsp. ruderalis]|uniref:Peptidase C14 caspase domain-containing protein n=2 Tax=Marchantia polymorpha TaxID=3197 RepID=A0AAF6BGB9_MARPO|nr:hypothetical protein MARPO_0086s0070 [Marchantia polymorpha]BBN11053.1 hypothetical protein Mp_5g08650 [Marchantia polymorpha subsp. ruderalis]|eukprot:PTQ33752.1 hypothetical protein MARPO_0086s0070 [Marchantia polymorpha]
MHVISQIFSKQLIKELMMLKFSSEDSSVFLPLIICIVTSNCFQYLVHFIHTTMNEAQYANMNVRRKKKRGLALLIGMEKGRDGSEADRNRVESMADYLHFVYTLIIDRKASDIQQVVESILAKDVKETDECIVCCVDAHGAVSDGIHFIYDNEGDGIELLSKILKPISDCDLLSREAEGVCGEFLS